MSQQLQELMNIVGMDAHHESSTATPIHLFPVKNRISGIGTTKAGKSAHFAGLVKAAEKQVAKTKGSDYPFFCQILENTSNILEDVARLRDGHFPDKTDAYQQFAAEAGLLLEWEHRVKVPLLGSRKLWTKRLQVPICDLAGEDLAQIIRQVRAAGIIGNETRSRVRQLISYVRQSDGYIIIIKATRARGLGKVMEEEVGKGLSKYADANLVRMIYDILTYKALHPERPVKGVAVVITAWDRLAPVAKQIGFDPLSPTVGQRDIEHFVEAAFPSTYAAITSMRVPNIRYFPSFFETEKNEKGEELCWQDEPDSPRIKKVNIHDPQYEWYDNVGAIKDSEKFFFDELNWLREFAMLG